MASDLTVPKTRGPSRGPARRRGINITELIEEGEAPLQVMIDNMLFWHKASITIGEQLSTMLQTAQASGEQLDLRTAMKMTSQLLAARENSQKCAVDAAPYCHPKLNAIAFQGEMNHTGEVRQIDEVKDTPAQAAEAWAELVSG